MIALSLHDGSALKPAYDLAFGGLATKSIGVGVLGISKEQQSSMQKSVASIGHSVFSESIGCVTMGQYTFGPWTILRYLHRVRAVRIHV